MANNLDRVMVAISDLGGFFAAKQEQSK